MKKSERQQYIQQFIEQADITRQEDLVQCFLDMNVVVTQATISRDIKEMKLIKVVGENGVAHYQMPINRLDNRRNDVGNLTVPSAMLNGADVLQVDQLNNYVSISVVPGHGPMVAMVIRQGNFPHVFTAIGDDSTVLVVCDTEEDARELQTYIAQLA
ncbi:arginine repressor [uncultured Limosilactobacillus sp.]|uniref:arginine repressor n=1 Tax=uncultured Limosilactobacillus sp. TaxID=2837629 RepID=UPI0025E6FA9B|nr:ArgR family transcriptional regulator [uncultured Limosilactobacillus sp.]